jgi:site-specific DNA-methyltransferase (adenine-specific)
MTTRKPYYEHAGITIYCGDCLDVMKDIPDGSVDMVLTDPLYLLADFRLTLQQVYGILVL